MSRVDLLIIGSSPLVLLRARALLRPGECGLILDRGFHPGGSWATPPMLGFDAVEPGVHLLENRRALYDALAGRGIALAPDCHGFGLVGGRRVSLAQSRVILHGLVAAKSAVTGAVDRARRIGLSAARAVGGLGAPFLYPPNGCRTIVEALRAALPEAELRLGCGVREIRLGTEGPARVATDAGEILAERVLIASRAHAPVFLDGHALPFELERSHVRSRLLRLRRAGTEPFGYVEVIGDPAVKRARDVSAFARPALAAGERLVCVQLRGACDGRETRDALVRIGLLPDSAELLDWAASDIALATLTDRCLAALDRRCAPRLKVVRTTDFADGYVSGLKNRR